MAQPLDYRNPKRLLASTPDKIKPQAAIPAEYDVVLTRSEDHPAVRAIEAALRRQNIPFHTSHDGRPARRVFELHIQSKNKDAAAQIAAKTFDTRRKVKAIPRLEMPEDKGSWPIGMDLRSIIP